MASRSKKVFWGLIFATFHIRLFGIELLPSCIGMALLYVGILDLEREGDFFQMGKKTCRYYRDTAAALVLASGFQNYQSIFRQESDGTIWVLIPCILEYIVFYFLIESYTAGKPQLGGLRRGYALVMAVTLTGYGVSLMTHTTVWQLFFVLIILVCRLMVLTAVFSDKKENTEAISAPAEIE